MNEDKSQLRPSAASELDALRWRQLPAHLEEFQIDYVGLKRAIDADLADPQTVAALRDKPQAAPVSEFERDGIARFLFNKVMSAHAQWDEMTEPNKDDWRVKADEWVTAAPVLIATHASAGLPSSWEDLTAIIRPMIESVCSDGNSDAARLAKDIAARIIASCSLTRPKEK